MTKTLERVMSDLGPGPGEAADRARRRQRNWTFAALAGTGLPIGFFAALLERDPGAGFMAGTLPPWFALVAAVVMTAAVIWGTLVRHRRMDELDRRDNLVAGAMAGNVAIVGYALWFLLWKGTLVPAPDAFWLFATTFVAALATYAYLKVKHHA